MKDKLTPKQKKLLKADIEAKQLRLCSLEKRVLAAPNFEWLYSDEMTKLKYDLEYLEEYLSYANTHKRKKA